jgi:putative transposase
MGKKHKPDEIVAKLRQVDVLTSQGTPIADAPTANDNTPTIIGEAI